MDNSNSKKSAPKSANPRIITMDSLRNSDQDERQAYFAGGSEHSGQQILGRGRRRDQDPTHESGQALAEAFRRATSNRNNLSNEPRIVSFRDGPQSFGGIGHRLGDTESPQPQTHQTASSQPQSQSETTVPGHVVLTLWENGYNFDNGPLQSYDDPRCAQLMANIDRGELPTNLLPYDRGDAGGPVHLSVVDKRGEAYRQSLKLFGGKGHKLGSPTPVLSSSGGASQDESQSNPPSLDLGAISENSSNDDIIFDDDGSNSDDMDYSSLIQQATRSRAFAGQGHVLESNLESSGGTSSHTMPKVLTVNGPTDFSNGAEKTSVLKLRLPDGKVLQITVSSSSTIGAVKQYIKQSVSGLSNADVIVQLSYPRRDLTDDESVSSSGISNSLLVLRINS